MTEKVIVMSELDELDLLLGQWAQGHRLPEHQSREIQRAITAPTVPSPAWWLSFTEQMADLVVRATTMPAQSGYRSTEMAIR